MRADEPKKKAKPTAQQKRDAAIKQNIISLQIEIGKAKEPPKDIVERIRSGIEDRIDTLFLQLDTLMGKDYVDCFAKISKSVLPHVQIIKDERSDSSSRMAAINFLHKLESGSVEDAEYEILKPQQLPPSLDDFTEKD